MDPEHATGVVTREPWLVRHGLVVAVVLAAATLLSALSGATQDDGDGRGGASAAAPDQQSTAPYGVADCQPGAGAATVDVAVSARALTAEGAPAQALGGGASGSGPEVGASVRDLAGYAAEGIAACGVIQVTVHLHDPTGGGSVPARLQRAPEPLAVAGQDGQGRLVALDWPSWEASLPTGPGAGDLEEQAAWFVTLVDPAPGTYRLTGRVTAGDPAAVAGDVEVLIDVTPTDAG